MNRIGLIVGIAFVGAAHKNQGESIMAIYQTNPCGGHARQADLRVIVEILVDGVCHW